MVSNEVLSWARLYYYTGIGLRVPDQLEYSDESIQQSYENLFLKPLAKLIHADDTNIGSANIVLFMNSVNAISFPGWIYTFKYIVESYQEKYTGDFSEYLIKCRELLTKESEMWYACVKYGKPFRCYRASGEIIGNYPVEIVLLSPVKHFPNGLSLSSLIPQSPIHMNDYSINVLRNAVKGGIIDESSLQSVQYMVPSDGWFVTKYVTACSEELPIYYVRSLISSLPEATLFEYDNPYRAALDYAEQHPDQYKSALRYLRNIFSKKLEPVVKEQVSNTELTDEMVFTYLSHKYNLDEEDIREKITVPTAQKLYTSPYLLNEDTKDMSAEEFMEYAVDNADSVTGTLDEIILAFCNEEHFDTSMSVDNLIRFIKDEPIVKDELRESFDTYVKENNLPVTITLTELLNKHESSNNSIEELIAQLKDYFSTDESALDMTLYEFIYGEQKPVDYKESVLDYMRSSELFDDLFLQIVQKALSEKKKVEYPTTDQLLNHLSTTDEIYQAIKQSIITGTELILPTPEVDDTQIVDYLTKKGIPRVKAREIVSGQSEVINNPIDLLCDLGLSEREAENAVINKTLKLANRLDDNAYRAAESLLYNIRKGISESDSLEFRESVLPIVYSFVRVLMISKGDEEEAIEFLRSKEETCNAEVIKYIEDAVRLIEGR